MIVRAIDDGATNASIVHGCWAPGLLPILLPVLDIAAVQDVVPSREMLDDNLFYTLANVTHRCALVSL